MKYFILLAVLGCSSTISAQNPIEKEGWELTFNDEFNDRKLDVVKWQTRFYWGGRYHENSLTYYGENQHQFTDSTLLLIADKKENDGKKPYSSGLIDCHESLYQKYGYFEIRSKNPKGEGFWPAFWLVTTASWPPEIDIYEFYTNAPNEIHTNLHWLNKKGAKKRHSKSYFRQDASADFHTYAVEWTKKHITWYYDNKKIRKSRRGVKHMIHPMHIIINLEVSEMKEMNLSRIKLPNTFEIDYVRVYKRK